MPGKTARLSVPVSLLVDINVILDVTLNREPWGIAGAIVLDAISRGHARGYIASHSVTTVYYLVEKAANRVAANTAVSDLLQLLTVVPLHDEDFQRALSLGLNDFEDAVQVVAALRVGANYIVTRNAKDFKGAPVPTRAPGEIVALLKVGRKS